MEKNVEIVNSKGIVTYTTGKGSFGVIFGEGYKKVERADVGYYAYFPNGRKHHVVPSDQYITVFSNTGKVLRKIKVEYANKVVVWRTR